MKNLGFLFFVFAATGCLSTSKNGAQEPEGRSSDAAAATINHQNVDDVLISECSIIYKEKRYIYNFYQDVNTPKKGTLYSIEPAPPLGEPYYEIEYESLKSNLIIHFTEYKDSLQLEINKKDWQGILYENERKKKTNYICEEFLI